eukprot:1122152-Pyramimonas_sp.AAC.1
MQRVLVRMAQALRPLHAQAAAVQRTRYCIRYPFLYPSTLPRGQGRRAVGLQKTTEDVRKHKLGI